MATRIEKKYRSNSLKLINNILKLIKEYAESMPIMGNNEALFCKSIIDTIQNFMFINQITDEEIKKAVER